MTDNHSPRRVLGANPLAFAAWAVLVGLSALHLGAHLAGRQQLADVSQWFLMPALAVALWFTAGPARQGRLVRLVVLALGLSWLGDAAPDLVPDSASFLTMLGFFFLAHLAYLPAFWPLRGRSVLARRPVLLLPYAVALVVLLALVAPGAGSLAVPVVLYGAVLTAVAVLATFDRVAAVGGVLFILSDALIALNAFVDGYGLSGQGFWVMVTYILAQVLLVVGVLRVSRSSVDGSGPLGEPSG